jgi:ASC-1-like (ASCH) protein
MYLIILFLLLGYIYFFYNYYFEYFEYTTNDIIILSKENTLAIIINNNDKYYNTFTSLDLQVRNVKSIEEYKKIISKCPITINNLSRNKIKKSIKKIYNIFKNYKYVGFDGNKANKITWKIGIVDGYQYEENFPHTRDDVIIIPKNLISKNDLTRVLIHEMVHIYQKIYPEDMQLFFDVNLIKNISMKTQNKNIRANPDIDGKIYSFNNLQMICLYKDNPKSIMDVIYPNNNHWFEHPYEYLAYSIENDIINKYNI